MSVAPSPTARRASFWLIVVVGLIYCWWLGHSWLRLGSSDKEFGGFISRLWDIKQELDAGRGFPWCTPFYMSGSSYGLHHTQGFYLLPSLLLAQFVSLAAAVKLTCLAAIFASGLAMYGCARYFLKNEWAATLAAVAFLLHPEHLIRGAGSEHLGVSVFLPFMPLTLWMLAKTLETGRWRDGFLCALSLTGMLWTHNKMAFIHGVFLACYVVYFFWPAARRKEWGLYAKRLGQTGLLAGLLALPLIVPGLLESKQVKLLSGEGEQLVLWQKNYSFKSLLALVDRDAWMTGTTTKKLQQLLQEQAFRPTSQSEADQLRAWLQRLFALQADSPEKYAGLVLLGVLAVVVLGNSQRQDRQFFWFAVGMLLLSVMLAMGLSNVWTANWETFNAIIGLAGVPSLVIGLAWLCVIVAVGFMVLFFRRKLTTNRKRVFALVALLIFLFVPAFTLLAYVPFFKEVRAPFVFYDGSGTFFVTLLAGFLVTDVLQSDRWRRHTPWIVAGIAALLLLDYWPYQQPMKDNGVPATTLRNLEVAYGALKQDGDRVKTYSLSGRYFHLLGPMYSGKPQVYEAFYNWMAPLGTGLLNQTGLSREFFNLVGARYIILDKTDPSVGSNQQLSESLRKMYPVALENEDFAVFRNATARGYVTAYAGACAYVGELRESAMLSLALNAQDWPLVHRAANDRNLGRYARVYPGVTQSPPPTKGVVVPLPDLQVRRETHGRLRLSGTAATNCLLVINESYYPFWRAEVDGRATEVLRVSTGLMGVEMPVGKHEIMLRYHVPGSYSVAGIISALALLAGIAWSVVECRRSKA